MAEKQLQRKSGVEAGTVRFTSQGTADGYLAFPADSGTPHPGVILVQEWWGIESHIVELTERLAREGYVVLAPDLYHGKVAQEPDEAQKAMMALDMPRAMDEISTAIDYLQGRNDVQPKRIGMVGFCMGGQLTWRMAEREDGELAAVAPFYGAGYDPTPESVRTITAPVLAVWGGDDPSVPAEQREKIVALLQQEGKQHKALTYDGAGHAFMNDKHDSYNPEVASQAWQELLAFFKQNLG